MTIVHHFKYKSAAARLVDWQDATATITHVFSRTKGQGHATEVLKKIMDYVEAQGYCSVYLEANPYGPKANNALNGEQLVKFYSKFGFTVVPDGILPPMMHKVSQ